MSPTLAQLTKRAIARDRWDDASRALQLAAESQQVNLLAPYFEHLEEENFRWRQARRACG